MTSTVRFHEKFEFKLLTVFSSNFYIQICNNGMENCVCGLERPFTSRSLKSAQVVRARNDTIYHGSQINNAMRGWLWFPRLYGAGNRPRKGINSSHANLWNFLWAKNRLIFLIWSFMFEGFFCNFRPVVPNLILYIRGVKKWTSTGYSYQIALF